jgi:hypothetical protein
MESEAMDRTGKCGGGGGKVTTGDGIRSSGDCGSRSGHILRGLALFIGLLFAFVGQCPAQETPSSLSMFGYLQAAFVSMEASAMGPNATTFTLQQMNLMGTNRFTPRLSVFFNLELTNSYSSKRGWGTLSLEEAWVKYSFNPYIHCKAGLITPTFNAFLQIKNKTPLIPYISRPCPYESSLAEVIDVELLLPMRANIEVYGTLPAGDMNLEYAVFLGNSDSKFTLGNDSRMQVSGWDSSTYKLIGGRLGLSSSWIRLGCSMTSDKENQVALNLGILQRFRYGIDLSLHQAPLTLEGEVILVRPRLGDREKSLLTAFRSVNPLIGENFDRDFWYGTLLCDLTEEWFAYGSTGYIRINDNAVMRNGINWWTVGGGWRAMDRLVLKAQYVRLDSPSPLLDLHTANFLLAMSVMF